jgi:hypothetical protein
MESIDHRFELKQDSGVLGLLVGRGALLGLKEACERALAGDVGLTHHPDPTAEGGYFIAICCLGVGESPEAALAYRMAPAVRVEALRHLRGET